MRQRDAARNPRIYSGSIKKKNLPVDDSRSAWKAARFSTLDAAAISGATLRMLQWWDERGIVRAGRRIGQMGSGDFREYTAEQVLHACVAMNLRGRGLNPSKCWKISKMVPVYERVRARYVLVVGEVGIGCSDPAEVLSTLKDASGPGVLVDLEDFREKILERVAYFRRAQGK